MWHMRDEINVMVYFKPGEYENNIFFSVGDTGILGKKGIGGQMQFLPNYLLL